MWYGSRMELFPFQRAELDLHWEKTSWGYCWDMGCGKSAVTIHNAQRLFDAGRIESMVVVAPNGVHRNWASDELPKHLPATMLEVSRVLTWYSSRAKTKKHAADVEAFLAPVRGVTRHRPFRVLLVSYDALMVDACAEVVKKLLTDAPALLVLDESQFVKAPDAARTKRVLAMAKHAAYRRILTGTLVPDKPFDVYSQIRFLDPRAWEAAGCGSFQAFKAQFGVWEQRFAARAGRFYPELQSYRNLDQMQAVVARHVSRVRKEEVLPELPPKLYSRRYFELSPAQRRIYTELRDEAMTVLASGDLITAPLVITRMLRMQQVTSGYVPLDIPDEDGERPLVRVGPDNPRLACLLESIRDLPHQAIVWAQRRQDIDDILEALREAGLTACRYDGDCSDDEIAAAKAAFKDGSAQFFVSNPAKGGTGLTLNEAKTMVFYNTGYKLAERLQAEDRAHRIGQDSRLAVIDLVAMLDATTPTLDLGILKSLSAKRELSAAVQGDEISEWLSLDSDSMR